VIDLAWLISGTLAGLAGVGAGHERGRASHGYHRLRLLVVIIAAAVLGGVGHALRRELARWLSGSHGSLAAFINPDYNRWWRS